MSTAPTPRDHSEATVLRRVGEPADRLTERQRARHDRSVSGIHGLMQRRPEMRGVYAPADAFEEALRWAV